MNGGAVSSQSPPPGLRPLTLFLVLGAMPFPFVFFAVSFRRIDAGFYRTAEFISAQHHLIDRVALAVTVSAMVASVLIFIRTLREPTHRAPRCLMIVGLMAMLVLSERYHRNVADAIMPALDAQAVARLADMPSLDPFAIGYAFDPEASRFVVTHDLAGLVAPEAIDPDEIIVVCRLYGGLFGGPVEDLV